MDALSRHVAAALGADVPRGTPLCVALSGGIDSSVLLHLLHDTASPRGHRLRALHVDHALQPQAKAWQAHCEVLCARLGVALVTRTVQVPDGPGQGGIEAAARVARYAAFSACLDDGEWLVTAHHQDDQLETTLLHLLRGSGPAGLAGIPARAPFARGRLWRPLLAVPRAELVAWAASRGVEGVEDPMNDDMARDRSYLRRIVVPLLRVRWPAVGRAVSRSAALAAEAAGMLADQAARDARWCVTGSVIDASLFNQLDEARQRNLIRWLAARRGWAVPPERRLREGLAQLRRAAPDRQPRVHWSGGGLYRYRGRIHLVDADVGAAAHAAGHGVWHWDARQPLVLGGWRGTLDVVQDAADGLDARLLAAGPLTVRFRRGGEVFQPAGDAHHRPLKYLFQRAGILPWMRGHVPLVYSGTQLVAVADLWCATQALAPAGSRGWRIAWTAHPDAR